MSACDNTRPQLSSEVIRAGCKCTRMVFHACGTGAPGSMVALLQCLHTVGGTPVAARHVPGGELAPLQAALALSRKAGVSTLNEFRRLLGLKPYKYFKEITDDVEVREALLEMYGRPDHIELMVGAMLEPSWSGCPGVGLGETASTAVKRYVAAYVTNDAFLSPRGHFHEGAYTPLGLTTALSTRLAHLLHRHAGTHLQLADPDRIFYTLWRPELPAVFLTGGAAEGGEACEALTLEEVEGRAEKRSGRGSIDVGILPPPRRTPDGAGQVPGHKWLGAAGQPLTLCAPPRARGKGGTLPDPEETVEILMGRKPGTFKPHAQGVSSLFTWFEVLLQHELYRVREAAPGSTPAAAAATSPGCSNGVSSYLDLQSLYGRSKREWAKVRTGSEGKLQADAYWEAKDPASPLSAPCYAPVHGLLILFSREHNRLCDQLVLRYPKLAGDDDMLFQTARLINCASFANVLVHDYLGTMFRDEDDPFLDPREAGPAPAFPAANLSSVEAFLLLQRSSMLPEGFSAEVDYGMDAPLKSLVACMHQVAGHYGPNNTPDAHLPQEAALLQFSRRCGTASYNGFRAALGLRKAETFHDLTGDPDVASALRKLYGHVDRLDLSVGALLEAPWDKCYGLDFGETASVALRHNLAACVTNDVFLSPHGHFNDQIYTPFGLAAAKQCRLAQLLYRHAHLNVNLANPDMVFHTIWVPKLPKHVFKPGSFMVGGLEAHRQASAQKSTGPYHLPVPRRAYDGCGQIGDHPWLGGAQQPLTLLCLGKPTAPGDLPPVEELRSKLLARKDGHFVPHPCGLNDLFSWFEVLLQHELFGVDLHGDEAAASRNSMSSYLDLQLLYGNSKEANAHVRTLQGGKLKPDATWAYDVAPGHFLQKHPMYKPVQGLLQLFNREHNRLADRLASQYPRLAADDEVLFHTARLVTTASFANVVVQDYLGTMFRGSGDEFSDPRRGGVTSNQPAANLSSVECCLLMRHSNLLRENLGPGDDADHSPTDAVLQALRTVAGAPHTRFNTPATGFPLNDGVIAFARKVGAPTLNAFREAIGLPRLKSFDELNPDPAVALALEDLYGEVDRVELYVGQMMERGWEGCPGAAFGETNAVALRMFVSGYVKNDVFLSPYGHLTDKVYTTMGRSVAQECRLAHLLYRHTGTALGLQDPDHVFYTVFTPSLPELVVVDEEGRVGGRDQVPELVGDGTSALPVPMRPATGRGSVPGAGALGASGAPLSVCLLGSLPHEVLPAVDDVAALLARGEARPHPARLNEMFVWFETLLAHELFRFEAPAPHSRNGMSSFLDLQTLYGRTPEEVAGMRAGCAEGKIKEGTAAAIAGGEHPFAAPCMAPLRGLLQLLGKEHNRVCEQLMMRYPKLAMDADLLFETARLVTSASFANMVVQDYLGSVVRDPEHQEGSGPSTFEDPRVAGGAPAFPAGNFGAVETALSMRHASLLREGFDPAAEVAGAADDLAAVVASLRTAACDPTCGAPAGVALGNMGSDAERLAHARRMQVAGFNEFREALGLPAYQSHEELAGSAELGARLEALYGADVDHVELYAGLAVEKSAGGAVALGQTSVAALRAFVAAYVRNDVFLSPHGHFQEKIYTDYGMQAAKSARLSHLLYRHLSFTTHQSNSDLVFFLEA